MTFRKILGSAVAGLCLSAASASAADLPSRAPPPVFVPPPPVFTWTGFYVGGYAGYSFDGQVRTTARVGSLDIKRKGFTGGGLAGYNYQFSSIVIGIEGDAGYDGEKAKGSTTLRLGTAALRVNEEEKSDGFIGRIRGRVGFAAGNFGFADALIYAAGGGSYLKEKFAFTALGRTRTTGQDRTGFNIGGGVDLAFGGHFILRAEYIYDDFGTESYPGLLAGIPFKAKLTDNTVRGALIYKF